MVTKSRLLTLKVDDLTLAEFAAAATIFRARSVSSFLHQYVVGQINEAKKMVSPEEFAELVAEHRKATEARSKLRARIIKPKKGILSTEVELNAGRKRKAG